jgi:hypothetical protein
MATTDPADHAPAEAGPGEPYVGGRILLEAGDVVEIVEKDAEGETTERRRARVKHSVRRYAEQPMWQTPLVIVPDAPASSPSVVPGDTATEGGDFVAANEALGEALTEIGMVLGLPKPRPGATWGAAEVLQMARAAKAELDGLLATAGTEGEAEGPGPVSFETPCDPRGCCDAGHACDVHAPLHAASPQGEAQGEAQGQGEEPVGTVELKTALLTSLGDEGIVVPDGVLDQIVGRTSNALGRGWDHILRAVWPDGPPPDAPRAVAPQGEAQGPGDAIPLAEKPDEYMAHELYTAWYEGVHQRSIDHQESGRRVLARVDSIRAAASPQGEAVCWLCNDLGGVAVHGQWTARRGKTLWTAHKPTSASHPVRPCPACAPRAAAPVGNVDRETLIRSAETEYIERHPRARNVPTFALAVGVDVALAALRGETADE